MRKIYLILIVFGLLFVVPNISAELTNLSSSTTQYAVDNVNQQHILSMDVNDNKFTHAIFRNATNDLVWIASNTTGASWGANSDYNDSTLLTISTCGSTDCSNSGSITSDSAGNLYVVITNDNYELYFIKGTYDSDTNSWSWGASTQLNPGNANQMYYPTILRQSTTGYSVNEDFLHIVVMANISTTYSEPAIYTSIDNGTTWGSTYPAYDDGVVEKIITTTPDMNQRFPAVAIKAAATQHKLFLAFDNGSKVDYIVGRYQDTSGFTWGTNYDGEGIPTNYNDGNKAEIVSNTDDNCIEPAITITNDIVHVTYLNSTTETIAEIMYIKKIDELSPWGPTSTVISGGNLEWNKLRPSIGKDTYNGLYILWGTYNAVSAGPGINAYIKYKKSLDAGDSWSASVIKLDATDTAYYPSIELSNVVVGRLWFIYTSNNFESVYVDFIATNCACPTTAGDWNVAASQTCKNGGCNLTGSLNVTAGLFELFNYTISLNSSTDGEFGVEVQSGAGMHVRENSNISAYNSADDPANSFYFRVLGGVDSFHYKRSYLSKCGYESDDPQYTGLYINSSTIIWENEFIDNYNGIVLNRSAYMYYNNITKNTNHGILVIGDMGNDLQVFDNRIFNNGASQLNNSLCEYMIIDENYWGSTNLTEVEENVTFNTTACPDEKYVDLCPIRDVNLDLVSCPGDYCNQDSDCVDDHRICLPDYNSVYKFCGSNGTVTNLYRLSTQTQFNGSSSSCVHSNRLYDNGTTVAPYVESNASWADSDRLNWSCSENYWSEDPFFNTSMDVKPTYIESLTTAAGFSEIIYILVPQLFLPNASVLFAELDIIGLKYGGGSITEEVFVDIGNDDVAEYNATSGLTQSNSPNNVTFTDFLNTYLPNCDCANCTADDQGNCLIGINVTTASATGKAILTNLEIGLCQMKGQTCTYDASTGEEGKCYDYGADADFDCMQSCTVLDDCPNAIDYECCSGSNVCAHDDFGCPSQCGGEDQDCCIKNTCNSGYVCRCVAEEDNPKCKNPTTSRYNIFNISEINESNFVYYTYENSTGDLNSCCLSPDNRTCRGWLNITAS
jgi:hypothetical protein